MPRPSGYMVEYGDQRVSLHMLAKLTGHVQSTLYTRYRSGVRGPALWAQADVSKHKTGEQTKRDRAHQKRLENDQGYQYKQARLKQAAAARDAAYAPALIDASLITDHERAHIQREVKRGVIAQAMRTATYV